MRGVNLHKEIAIDLNRCYDLIQGLMGESFDRHMSDVLIELYDLQREAPWCSIVSIGLLMCKSAEEQMFGSELDSFCTTVKAAIVWDMLHWQEMNDLVDNAKQIAHG